MAIRASCSLCCFPSSLSTTFLNCPNRTYQISLRRQPLGNKRYNVQSITSPGVVISKKGLQRRNCFPVPSEDLSPDNVVEVVQLDALEVDQSPLDFIQIVDDTDNLSGDSNEHITEKGGKPGFVSFYNRQPRKDNATLSSTMGKTQNNLLWFTGPAIPVASFILPSLYLRKIISTIFEDSLLTDFLILFFTEALFYCGVAVFLHLIHRLWSPNMNITTSNDLKKHTSQIGHRISDVTILMLSLVIPMVSMGFVWPWTGPAASAALAPYLVGIVVQFAFEQYARYTKSPSWSVIPIVFQVYRLHQLNRAAQLVTALCFTVRGAEMTSHNLAINKSLGTLLNILQVLGLICIWSLSSFLMRFFPSYSVKEQ